MQYWHLPAIRAQEHTSRYTTLQALERLAKKGQALQRTQSHQKLLTFASITADRLGTQVPVPMVWPQARITSQPRDMNC